MKPATPDVSIVIVSYNTCDLLQQCLEPLRQPIPGLTVEVLVVDNASHDGSADMVSAQFPDVQLLRSDTNLGFAAANNLAFAQVRGRYVVLLNPDARMDANLLSAAVRKMEATPLAGAAGGRLLGLDGALQPSARCYPSVLNDFLTYSGLAARFPRSRFFGRFDRTWADPLLPAPVEWVPGAFLVLRRSALDVVGGFDDRFFLYYEEVDLCRRIRSAGYQIWYWPELTIRHIGGQSSKTVDGEAFSRVGSQLTLWRMRSALLYYRKHHGVAVAWLARRTDELWHRLRRGRNWRRDDPWQRRKREDSQQLIGLWRRAWQDTQGGSVCPPRPW